MTYDHDGATDGHRDHQAAGGEDRGWREGHEPGPDLREGASCPSRQVHGRRQRPVRGELVAPESSQGGMIRCALRSVDDMICAFVGWGYDYFVSFYVLGVVVYRKLLSRGYECVRWVITCGRWIGL